MEIFLGAASGIGRALGGMNPRLERADEAVEQSAIVRQSGKQNCPHEGGQFKV
jgi:hypothetical protein